VHVIFSSPYVCGIRGWQSEYALHSHVTGYSLFQYSFYISSALSTYIWGFRTRQRLFLASNIDDASLTHSIWQKESGINEARLQLRDNDSYLQRRAWETTSLSRVDIHTSTHCHFLLRLHGIQGRCEYAVPLRFMLSMFQNIIMARPRSKTVGPSVTSRRHDWKGAHRYSSTSSLIPLSSFPTPLKKLTKSTPSPPRPSKYATLILSLSSVVMAWIWTWSFWRLVMFRMDRIAHARTRLLPYWLHESWTEIHDIHWFHGLRVE